VYELCAAVPVMITSVRLQLTCRDIPKMSNITQEHVCCLSAVTVRACVVPCCEDSLGAVPLFREIHSNGLELASQCRQERQLTSFQLEGKKRMRQMC
jgi:hypothetical protein